MNISDKIRESRKITVKLDAGVEFYAHRLTVEGAVKYHQGMTDTDLCRQQVFGWSGITSNMLCGDGGTEPVPFDQELFDLAIGDNPEWWAAIAEQVSKYSMDRMVQIAESKKKSMKG